MNNHIPVWQRNRLGDQRHNYLEEGYKANGAWYSMPVEVRELINKANKI